MKTKTQTWESLPRASKLAACLWPSLVPENIKAEMRTIPYGQGEADPSGLKLGM
jgi:hypothetical protein